jgi:hypothetical protein
MSEGEGFLGEVAEDITGVAETAGHAVEGVYDGATGDWNGAADSAQSMSESAIGVATAGVSELVEAGWDALKPDDMPSAHEAIHDGLQSAGSAIGDGLESIVGDEHALASANDFDDGKYLSGIGEMAEGIGETAYNGAANLASSAYDEVSDVAGGLLQGAESLFE